MQSGSMRVLAAILSLSGVTQATFKFPAGFKPVYPDYSVDPAAVTPRSPDDLDVTGQEEARGGPGGGSSYATCRYLPSDAAWPSQNEWNGLNNTVGGRLIRGEPVARNVCYGATTNEAACATLREKWGVVDPFLTDPVNLMSPYWLNNSCSPFLGPAGSCTQGNIANYAIRVAGANDVIAGLQFARDKNIRLTIKNTGHDYLGRSTGEGSLALWTYNLKDISVIDYRSSRYTGKAVKVGAGVGVLEAYTAAKNAGLRVVGGNCPTVGLAGGWLPGGGHGPLAGAYGLGADQALEFDVVTARGQRLTASPTQNSDLYWALSGGGPGNYAVVLSVTVKAYPDGPVAGSSILFVNTNPDSYYAAVKAWIERLAYLDVNVPKLSSVGMFTNEFFSLDPITLPDATEAQLQSALAPFLAELARLNITVLSSETRASPTFLDHYRYFTTDDSINGTSLTIGNRLIPRSLTRPTTIPTLISTIRGIAASNPAAVFSILSNNVKAQRENSVLPAWRDSLFLLDFGIALPGDAASSAVKQNQATVNSWIDSFRAITRGGGSYANEATWDNANWKADYYGANYNRLAGIKARYDPEYLLFGQVAVGSDAVWKTANADGSGRLCRRSGR